MAEVLFYHLTDTPLEQTLPELIGRALDRGWACVVRASDLPALKRLDDLLWTFSDEAFLPHGTAALGHEAEQPVFLTTGPENPARANVAMLVDGARLTLDDAREFERICLLFNGYDEGALTAAREDWVKVREAGLTGTYWAQMDGRWREKAKTGQSGTSPLLPQ